MTRITVSHQQTAQRLRLEPGVWQPVGLYASRGSANMTASLIRTGGYGIGIWYRPDGSFEARTRPDTDGVAVEARYVGAGQSERQHAAPKGGRP